MTRSKLSGPEKQEIAVLYEHQQESITSLAERYQVSSSTIRRLLKNLPKPSQSKRNELVDLDQTDLLENDSLESDSIEAQGLETENFTSGNLEIDRVKPLTTEASESAPPTLTSSKPKPIPKSKLNVEGQSSTRIEPQQTEILSQPLPSQSASSSDPVVQETDQIADSLQETPSESIGSHRPVHRSRLPKKISERPSLDPEDLQEPEDFEPIAHESRNEQSKAMLGSNDELSEILLDLGQSSNQSFSETEDEDDDDFDGLDDDDDGDFDGFLSGDDLQIKSDSLVEVMPFADAVLPKTCYLVIDRTAELVTRPLKDFGELGQIPEAEIQARTLPIFDNHRIARRFSHRNQRIIKVPNAEMLKKTSLQLSAKGITRLLVNGHIYSL
jgi:transposase-like protein